MVEKEERILIARSTDYTISDTKDGALFEGKIAPHNANVYTRQEAIERMAKAIRERACEDYLHKDTDPLTSTASAIDYAEAALNALLEEK